MFKMNRFDRIIRLNVSSNGYKLISFSPTQIIVMGFVLLIITGAILLKLPISSRAGVSIGFLDALFTATSAACVTGLVVVDTNSFWSPFGQVVIVMLIQIGGLGIMSFATFFSLLTGRRVGLKERLTIQESFNDVSMEGIVRTLKKILIIAISIEAIGGVLLSIRLIPKYGFVNGLTKSFFHSISAFCNAGFDIFGTEDNKFVSLTGFSSDTIVILVISILVIIGGLGFIVWKDIGKVKKIKDLSLHSKVVLIVSGLLIVFGTLIFLVFEHNNPNTLGSMNWGEKLLNSFFAAVTPRTAGFNTIPIDAMHEESKFLTIILMFIGGAPGSTAGGVKITTVSVLVFAVIAIINGEDDVNIMRRRISWNVIRKALAIVMMVLLLNTITTMVLLFKKEGRFLDVVFEVFSASGTVGLSTGITPELSISSKVMIIFTMFFGRVGPITAAVALTLRQGRKKQLYKFPESKIVVG